MNRFVGLQCQLIFEKEFSIKDNRINGFFDSTEDVYSGPKAFVHCGTTDTDDTDNANEAIRRWIATQITEIVEYSYHIEYIDAYVVNGMLNIVLKCQNSNVYTNILYSLFVNGEHIDSNNDWESITNVSRYSFREPNSFIIFENGNINISERKNDLG